MKYKEFLNYWKRILSAIKLLCLKPCNFSAQRMPNGRKKTAGKIKKMEKAAGEMWKKAMENLYSNLKLEIKSEFPSTWISYIEKHEILKSVNESINELNFSEDAA